MVTLRPNRPAGGIRFFGNGSGRLICEIFFAFLAYARLS
jgi:hypothetical protein